MARWTRAIAALPFRSGRVLDLGCAFGLATRMLKRRGYDAVGVDASPAYIARAQSADPQSTYILADAANVPLADASFDGVVFLDVLEHLPDEHGAISEVARLLKPGGTVVVSVPHRGPLAWLDSLNVYARFVKLTHHGKFPPEIAATGVHHHYSVGDLRTLLGPEFVVTRVERTGLGLAEVVNLVLQVLFRWLVQWERAYQIAAFAYYTVYLVEDMLPLGPFGYHLLLAARKLPAPTLEA